MAAEMKDVGTQAVMENNGDFVVNEFLAFTTNRINSMPYDMIFKLLTDFYAEETVEEAKDILRREAYRSTDPPRSMSIKRKGKDRLTKTIQDILNARQEMDSSSQPCFEARI